MPDKTLKAVREYRKKYWTKALKKAKGDVDKAYEIYIKEIKTKRFIKV